MTSAMNYLPITSLSPLVTMKQKRQESDEEDLQRDKTMKSKDLSIQKGQIAINRRRCSRKTQEMNGDSEVTKVTHSRKIRSG